LANEVWLKSKFEGRRLVLAAAGAWTATNARSIEPAVEAAVRDSAKAEAVSIDLAGLERIDTFGAWLIERLVRAFAARGCEARIVGLSDKDRGLMEKVERSATRIANNAGAEITDSFIEYF
jgi:phospholipid/cholesterol/gamma-HCH transport system permease protein